MDGNWTFQNYALKNENLIFIFKISAKSDQFVTAPLTLPWSLNELAVPLVTLPHFLVQQISISDRWRFKWVPKIFKTAPGKVGEIV